MTGKAKQKITAELVLDYYEKSKNAKGEKKKLLYQTAVELSKHLNEWLVVPGTEDKKS